MVVAADAPFGVAGIGRHLAELVAVLRADGLATTWMANARGESPDEREGQVVVHPKTRRVLAQRPLRGHPDLRARLLQTVFDNGVARRLPRAIRRAPSSASPARPERR